MPLNIDLTALPPADLSAISSDWKQAIIGRISSGRVIPVISNAFINDLVFDDHQWLIQTYAERHIQYPMADQGHDLARMAQWHTVTGADVVGAKQAYLDFLKNVLSLYANQSASIDTDKKAELEEKKKSLSVTGMCEFLDFPNLDATHPLRRLAAMPFKIYVTTSYHGILERALEKANKMPVVEVFAWRDGLGVDSVFDTDPSYSPSVDRPLVLHLHGIDHLPESLVLTEDDYLDFMADVITKIKSMPKVEAAIGDASLVVLGYRLPCWDFRVLFRIIRALRRSDILGKSVAVQRGAAHPEAQPAEAAQPAGDAQAPQEAVQPEDDSQESQQMVTVQLQEADRGEAYLRQYLRQQVKFEVIWKDDPGEFIRELYQGWDKQP